MLIFLANELIICADAVTIPGNACMIPVVMLETTCPPICIISPSFPELSDCERLSINRFPTSGSSFASLGTICIKLFVIFSAAAFTESANSCGELEPFKKLSNAAFAD